jgi:hypothetical protein
MDAFEDTVEPLAFAAIGQAIDVLEQKTSWLRIAQHAQVGSERFGSGVNEAHSIATRPIARLGEWLTRRTTDQDVSLALFQLCRLQQLRRRDLVDIPLYYRPVAVEAQGSAAYGIHLDSNRRLESGSFKAEVQAPDACEQADCLWHLNRTMGVRTKVEQTGACVKALV